MTDLDRHLPGANQCDTIATTLENTARWIRMAPAVLNASVIRNEPEPRPRAPRPAGLAGIAELGNHDDTGSAPRSPTEAAALSSKVLEDKKLAIRSLLAWLDTNAVDIVAAINDGLHLVDPAYVKTTTGSDDCAEPNCENKADHHGRCNPCHTWRDTWRTNHGGQPAPPVPASVIDARTKLDTGARVYVSGPHEGEVA